MTKKTKKPSYTQLVKANRELREELELARPYPSRFYAVVNLLNNLQGEANRLRYSLAAANKETAQVAQEVVTLRQQLEESRNAIKSAPTAQQQRIQELEASLVAANKRTEEAEQEAVDLVRHLANANNSFRAQRDRLEEAEERLCEAWNDAGADKMHFRDQRLQWFAREQTLNGQVTSLLRALSDCQQKGDAAQNQCNSNL